MCTDLYFCMLFKLFIIIYLLPVFGEIKLCITTLEPMSCSGCEYGGHEDICPGLQQAAPKGDAVIFATRNIQKFCELC